MYGAIQYNPEITGDIALTSENYWWQHLSNPLWIMTQARKRQAMTRNSTMSCSHCCRFPWFMSLHGSGFDKMSKWSLSGWQHPIPTTSGWQYARYMLVHSLLVQILYYGWFRCNPVTTGDNALTSDITGDIALTSDKYWWQQYRIPYGSWLKP